MSGTTTMVGGRTADVPSSAAGRHVLGSLGYIEPGVERPYSFMYEPPAGVVRENCRYDIRRVEIADARRIRHGLGLDRQGFELRDVATAVRNFRDETEVVETYYEEVRQLALAVTGASRAYVFDHLVRKREAGRPPLTFGRHGDGSNPAAVGRVHNDYSEASGLRRLQSVLAIPAADLGRRFAVVNVWRSIAGPVVDTPLALCDARSVSPHDLVAAEIRYQIRVGEIYLARFSPHHRWHYFPNMHRGEALVFKQFDSNPDVARYALHCAFDLPDVPAEAPLRESIEARCLVVHD